MAELGRWGDVIPANIWYNNMMMMMMIGGSHMPLSKEAKKYTYTDYQEFPDDERWEIIDWRERILDRRTGHKDCKCIHFTG